MSSYKPKSKDQNEREDKLVEMVSFSLTRRDWYDRWAPVVNAPWMDGARMPKRLAEAFGHFYVDTEEPEVLVDDFEPWCRMAQKFTDAELDKILPQLKEFEIWRARGDEPGPAFAKRLEMEAQALGMSKIVKEYREGKPIDMLEMSRSITASMEERLKVDVDEVIDIDIDELLHEDDDNSGLSFRLPALNMAVKKLSGGKSIIVAARPDQGKSSFIASEITWFAQQLRATPDDPRTPRILWLNNEGKGNDLVKRLYQAALNATVPDLALRARNGTLREDYLRAINNCDIEVKDTHGWSTGQMETLIKNKQPHIVVFDMLDNVTYSGTTHDGGNRTDQVLEEKYKWARNQCVIHNFISIATSQISDAGEGMKFPPYNYLKDSRTGKQGACDIIIMIGSEGNGSDYRYISTPKNKHPKMTCRDPRAEVVFDPHRSRFFVPGYYQ